MTRGTREAGSVATAPVSAAGGRRRAAWGPAGDDFRDGTADGLPPVLPGRAGADVRLRSLSATPSGASSFAS